MRTRSRRASRWKQQPDINLNAFLDLVLNLLLFFVFATELAVFDTLDVHVPVSQYSEAQTTERQAMMIFITKDNEFFADGERITLSDLSRWLSQKKMQDNRVDNIIVRGDLSSNLQATVDVLDACRAAGIYKVKIETIKPL
jgi:biopolymer transport protein ExbD